ADASDESAAADRDNDRIHVRALLQELEPEGALAGDHPLVVEGMDEGQSSLGRDLPRAAIRFVVVGTGQDDLCAMPSGGRHLDERCPLLYFNDAADTETRRVEGD